METSWEFPLPGAGKGLSPPEPGWPARCRFAFPADREERSGNRAAATARGRLRPPAGRREGDGGPRGRSARQTAARGHSPGRSPRTPSSAGSRPPHPDGQLEDIGPSPKSGTPPAHPLLTCPPSPVAAPRHRPVP